MRSRGGSGRRQAALAAWAVAAAFGWIPAPAVAAFMQAPNSRVSLDLPPGYAPARNFSGFQSADLGSSILVQEMPPAAYEEITAGFTPAALKTRGIRNAQFGHLGRSEDHIFIRGAQSTPAGDFAKFILVMRAPEATVLITANVPRTAIESGAVKTESIEATLATARLGERAEKRALYEIGHTGGPFRPAGSILGTATLYTLDGKLEPDSKGKARAALIVAPSLDQRPPPALEPLAARLIASIAGLKDIKPGPVMAVSIGGLKGVVAEAEASNEADGEGMRVIQVLLAPADGGYYRLVGMAPAAEAETVMPELRRMIDSFRLSYRP